MGTAQVSISFDTWKDGKVGATRHDVPVVAPRGGLKLETVSPRLRRELIHPHKTATLVDLRFSPDGRQLIAGDDPGGVVMLWDVESGRQLTRIDTGYDDLRLGAEYIFVSPDWKTLYVDRTKRKYEPVDSGGKRLTRWEFDGGVRAWDLATGQLQKTYKHQPARNIVGMEFSPDGTKFVTFEQLPGVYEDSGRGAVSLWDVKTGQPQPLPDNLQSPGLFSPDGRTMAVTAVGGEHGYAEAVKLFDVATGRERLSIPITDKNTNASVSAFSPDGRFIAVDYSVHEAPGAWENWQSALKLWDAGTGREVASFTGDRNDGLVRCRFSPDGGTLAFENWLVPKRQLFLYSVPQRKLAKTLVLGENPRGHMLLAREPVFSPDSKWIALITRVIPLRDLDLLEMPQPRIHLIDVAAGEIRETLIAPHGFPRAVCFSPDGKTLATGGLGRVLLWDLTRLPSAASRTRDR